MFEKIRLEFLIDKSKYGVNNTINDIRNYILQQYEPSSVQDKDCGEVSKEEAIDEWGFSNENMWDEGEVTPC